MIYTYPNTAAGLASANAVAGQKFLDFAPNKITVYTGNDIPSVPTDHKPTSSGISIVRHGAKESASDNSAAINRAILEAEETNTFVIIPAVATRWRIGNSIIERPGVRLIGEGYLRSNDCISGSVISRTGAFPMFVSPSAAENGSAVNTGMGAKGIFFNGAGHSAPIMELRKVGNFRLSDCVLAGSGSAPLLKMYDQVQDSWFERNHFEQAQPLTSGVIDIDDSLGTDAGHIQNLVFYANFVEAYKGPAFKIYGKGAGPGASLIDFIRNKCEGLSSDYPHLDFADASQISLDNQMLMGKGLSGAVPQMIKMARCQKVGSKSIRVGWMTGGATLGNIASLDQCSDVTLDFVPSFAAVVDNLTGTSLVMSTASSNIEVKSTYKGNKALHGNGTINYPVVSGAYRGVAVRGNGSTTLTAGIDKPVQRFNAPLTANRTITLSTTGATEGDPFTIVRTAAATGAYSLDVGGLKSLATAGTWCEVVFDGAAWVLVAAGTL